ncbi:MAG TPA: outer membrane protein assembly factor BamA [Myxococcales bacterium]|nr:outer membrane protein assembly factor BamA [Myxococcales bacterium]
MSRIEPLSANWPERFSGDSLQPCDGTRKGRALVLALVVHLVAGQATAQESSGAVEYGAIDAPATASMRVAVLPFRLHSAQSLEFLSGALDELLAERIEAGGAVGATAWLELSETSGLDLPRSDSGQSDLDLRRLAEQAGVDGVVSGSLTELAGQFSLDVRVTSVDPNVASESLVLAVGSDRELLDRLGDLAERIANAIQGTTLDRVVEVRFEGAEGFESELVTRLSLRAGAIFEPGRLEADRRLLESDPRFARVAVSSQPVEGGVALVYRLTQATSELGLDVRVGAQVRVVDVVLRGNQRIKDDAIFARIRTLAGEPYDRGQVARDVRSLFAQGFYRDVRVFIDETPSGVRVVFELDESPIVRKIAVEGNDNIDGEKIRDALTLTTGSPLDHPLLRENAARVEALYRSEGYFLAHVGYEIEEISAGSILISFNVEEKEKLKLREINFVGNKAFSETELRADFATKPWRFYSLLTSWFDRTGTYSEPIFLRDLRLIEKKYADDGYVQSRIGEPEVDANEDGLFLTIEIVEGPQFTVGGLTVEGDETIDLDVLRKKIRLGEGEIFNRSDLTADIEILEAHYTDRGFFFANVNPITQTNQETLTVDVQFAVEKGPLYFVRNVDIRGNTRTIDAVIRREIRLVEGQLYSARALQVSNFRIRGLGFFEDVAFEPNTTEDPSQLDLDVNVVERATGSFSFGAGYSSADSFIFNASLAQSNLFGRGYGANISADIGGKSSRRFFVSVTDPRFLGSTFSFSTTAFLTQTRFDDFEQDSLGIEFRLGHPLTVDNRASISVLYGFSNSRVQQDANVNGLAAPIARQVLQGRRTTSRIGIAVGIDTRNDRFAPTAGYAARTSLEYAGLGGFSNYLTLDGSGGYYFGAPDWLIERSTFVASTRFGYALPFNQLSDFDVSIAGSTVCENPANCSDSGNLDQLDDDIRLPLTERYFLGGLGSSRLRGYEGRSVGPRRAELHSTDLSTGRVFHPVGTRLISNPATGELATLCDDRPGSGNSGNGNGICNSTGDKRFKDFDDISESQVIGGASFISSSLEYRMPISEEIGLLGFLFVDGGNAFVEGDVLFDVTDWRYGYGGGVLWFSPFGPLQLVLGFPIDPRSNEKSPVFEFSVGSLGI